MNAFAKGGRTATLVWLGLVSMMAGATLMLACGGDDLSTSSDSISENDRYAMFPSGSAAEQRALAIVNNDSSTLIYHFGLPVEASRAIEAYRNGDDLVSTSDDQRISSLEELDSIPYTNDAFWRALHRAVNVAPWDASSPSDGGAPHPVHPDAGSSGSYGPPDASSGGSYGPPDAG